MTDARANDPTWRYSLPLASELRAALDDPKRYEWGEGPWEHLGDAERDVRVLLEELARLEAEHKELDEALDQAVGMANDHASEILRLEAEHTTLKEALERWVKARERANHCRDEFGWKCEDAYACQEYMEHEDTAAEALAALAAAAGAAGTDQSG